MTDPLLLDDDTALLHLPLQQSHSVSLAPLVLFSLLDHYIRRPHDDDHRVMGVLLGARSNDEDTTIEIRNCFPLQMDVDNDGTFSVNATFVQQLYGLHQRVNPKEIIVGWYCTGVDLDEYSLAIHEFFANETSPHQPIHLLVDTKMVNERLSIRAFIRSAIGVPQTAAQEKVEDGGMFIQVPCQIVYAENERVTVDMVSASKEEPEGLQLLSDMDNLERSVVAIQGMLESIGTYVQSVREGKIEANNAIGRFLMDTISAVPRINSEDFEKLFNNHLQDLLMVVYLSNLTRAQLAIAQRLQRLT